MALLRRIERAAASGLLSLPTPILAQVVGARRAPRSPEGFTLDVQSQALLWLARIARQPDFGEESVALARARNERAAALFAPSLGGDVVAVDRFVPGGSGPRRARIYTPRRAKTKRASLPERDQPGERARPLAELPGLLWFHGGGFVLGSIETHDGVCRALARLSGVVVASLDYRLAPEHPFPAGVEDALRATRWMTEHGREIGVDCSRVYVGGDSAGGNLAAVVAQTLRGTPAAPAFQLLVYPSTDATRGDPSQRTFATGYLLTAEGITHFLEHYLPKPELATDVRCSPVLAADFRGLPPALVITAGFDPLRDEGRRYARRMSEAGVPVEEVCFEGAVHGFMSAGGVVRLGARAIVLAADSLRRAARGDRPPQR